MNILMETLAWATLPRFLISTFKSIKNKLLQKLGVYYSTKFRDYGITLYLLQIRLSGDKRPSSLVRRDLECCEPYLSYPSTLYLFEIRLSGDVRPLSL